MQHTLKQLKSGELRGLKRLSISAELDTFPEEIYDLADTLEILDLSNNRLSSLPQDFGRLSKLKAVFFFNNRFEEIPLVLRDCPDLDTYGFRYNRIKEVTNGTLPARLRWLILTGNQIKALPGDIGLLQNLQKCMLAGNQLTQLPEQMKHCCSLELLRISSNNLRDLPDWLLSMPKLTWLAFAGNPFDSDALTTLIPTPSEVMAIHWDELALGEQLGEGASGQIYKATWRGNGGSARDLAIKLFKAEMTSDGSPSDEMIASLRVASHNNAVSTIAKLTGHPEGKRGLVMELIPEHFENMAGPPSLESCTRDVYPEDRSFSGSELLNVAKGMAAFAQHCHRKGVMHGDLYPHNTLIDKSGKALLGDYGAASCFDPKHTQLAKRLENLEVRAWGCALDDMLRRVQNEHGNSIDHAALRALDDLKQACMSLNPEVRPSFSEIADTLENISVG